MRLVHAASFQVAIAFLIHSDPPLSTRHASRMCGSHREVHFGPARLLSASREGRGLRVLPSRSKNDIGAHPASARSGAQGRIPEITFSLFPHATRSRKKLACPFGVPGYPATVSFHLNIPSMVAAG